MLMGMCSKPLLMRAMQTLIRLVRIRQTIQVPIVWFPFQDWYLTKVGLISLELSATLKIHLSLQVGRS